MRRNPILLLVASSILCGVAISRLFGADEARLGPMQELSRLRPARPFAARLSIPTEYHPCTPLPADSVGTVPREACGTAEQGSLSLRQLDNAKESTDPDSLRASGLAAIIWPERTNDQALGDAITTLQRALRLSTHRVPLLVDLSAAHLVRAGEREQNPRDLVVAMQYALEALALEPKNAAACFNAALAMQAFGLDEEAALAWDAYLAIDSTSPWAEEAHSRKEGLITEAAEIPLPAPGAPAPEVAEFAREFPQEAREYGWNQVLRDWGAATAGEDSAACTEALLRLAEQLGRALAERSGGDASLADAVKAIRDAQADPAATIVLARAHQEYADGQAFFHDLKGEAASAAFDRVIRFRPASPVLLQWTTLYHAGARQLLRKPDEAESGLRGLLEQVDSIRHPVLEGRTRLMLGTMMLQRGYEGVREQSARAAKHLARAGETENKGGVLSLDGEAAYREGDTVAAYQSLYRAQQALRPYRRSIPLHKQLHGLARIAALDGMPRAALAILNEDVRVAKRVGTPVRVLDALQTRARVRTSMGNSRSAVLDMDSARASLQRLPPEEAQQQWAQAHMRMAGPGKVSAAAMDSAVTVFAQNVFWLVPALLQRADARLAAGDETGAAADLESVVAGIHDAARESGDPLLRGALLEQARSSFDRLVMLYLRQGRPADALRALERGRLSFAARQGGAASARDGRLAAPAGHVAVEYALIGDTLLTWTVRGDTTRIRGQLVERDEFILTVEQVTAALESPARDADALPGLRRLYDWLIRPVRGYLGARETPLVILADGEVAGIPFAALLDSVTGQYLVQDYPIRFAATLADAARPASGREGLGRALLVADPAFDVGRYRGLFPLDSARAEVRRLRGLYPSPDLLEGESATREAFLERMRGASVVHYAGHAVFDDARPERSYLLLAGADTTGRLTAEAVSAMRLDGVRLVVLSACRTLRSREGRSGGFSGFSGALLAAGAEGVVGSLWEVSDRYTPPLMAAFHQELLRSGDPAHALREAQLRMLDPKGDPSLWSPSIWAGFRYTGAGRP